MTAVGQQETKAVSKIDFEARQVRILSDDAYKQKSIRAGSVLIEPYAPVLGGEVTGFRFDKDAGVDEPTRQLLYKSLLEFGFLSFEPGSIAAEDFEAFTAIFGHAKFSGNPYAPQASATSQANALDSHYKKTRTNYIWHIDQAYRPNPQKFTALFGLKVPKTGGDTVFSNAVAAFELFDPLFARYLETLTVVHDADAQGLLTLAYTEDGTFDEARRKNPPLEVPLVRIHPETGAKQIFANELYAQRILGVSRTMSDLLLSIVFEQIKTPEIGAHYQWREGAVLIWDNRTVQHRGVFNYADQHRSLLRAVIN